MGTVYRKGLDQATVGDPEPALKLWRHLFGGESGLLHIFTAIRSSDELTNLKENYFPYPQAAKAAAEWAHEKAAEGREAYFCAHLLTKAQRIKDNAAAVRTLWGDLDGAPLPNGDFRPTGVVESSAGRYHAYWRLTDSIPPDSAELLNERLAQVIGADPSGFDLSQLLRVPGTVNHKYPDRPQVQLLDIRTDHEYVPGELDERLPKHDAAPDVGSTAEGNADEPPVVLSPPDLEAWRGENPKYKEGGEVDKSATLMKIGRVLYDAGLNKRPLVDALAERDKALGYDKYSGNRDGGQREYERIYEKLQAAGRNPRGISVILGGQEDEDNTALEMDAAAYRGLFGDIVEAVDPHTEGDPVAVLASALVGFGNALGRGPYVEIGATKHRVNLFCGIVGDTAKGRKGSTWDPIENIMHAADKRWAEGRILSGLSSGEGLISEVRDPVEMPDKDGKMQTTDAGASDKRLLVMESELSQALKVMKREGNTLSPVMRNAWDGKNLRTMVKHSPHRATDPHIAVLGHITSGELVRHLTETEMANGLANRFLWLLVKRSKLLPFGGEWHTVNLQPLTTKVVAALDYGNSEMRMTWAAGARALWSEAYEVLTEDRGGMFGAVTARAEAQALRLAMLYALADLSRGIEYRHVESALAVWQYAEESARSLFGDLLGDPDADKLLAALREVEGGSMTRNEVRELFGRNKGATELDRIRTVLLKARRIRVSSKREGDAKKPTERWYAA